MSGLWEALPEAVPVVRTWRERDGMVVAKLDTGITSNVDGVARTVFQRLEFHPAELWIQGGAPLWLSTLEVVDEDTVGLVVASRGVQRRVRCFEGEGREWIRHALATARDQAAARWKAGRPPVPDTLDVTWNHHGFTLAVRRKRPLWEGLAIIAVLASLLGSCGVMNGVLTAAGRTGLSWPMLIPLGFLALGFGFAGAVWAVGTFGSDVTLEVGPAGLRVGDRAVPWHGLVMGGRLDQLLYTGPDGRDTGIFSLGLGHPEDAWFREAVAWEQARQLEHPAADVDEIRDQLGPLMGRVEPAER